MRSRPSRLTEEERLFTLPSLRSCQDFGDGVDKLDSVPWVEERITPRRPTPGSRRTDRRDDRFAVWLARLDRVHDTLRLLSMILAAS